MNKKRVLLLAHGKKAEDEKFQEAFKWLTEDGHKVELIKTGSEEDMAKGVQKFVSSFDSRSCDCSELHCTYRCMPFCYFELQVQHSTLLLSKHRPQYMTYTSMCLCDADYDILMAAGGDGTINQVANELMKQDAPSATCLAVIPLGTANDLATSLSIRDDDLVQAMQTGVKGECHHIADHHVPHSYVSCKLCIMIPTQQRCS